MSNVVSTFEMLPDDLLLELFELYIHAKDLYRNFLGFNTRLNGILISCRLRITTGLNDLNNSEYIQFLSSRVIGWRADYFNEKLVKLSRCHQLRSLHIKNLSSELSIQWLKPLEMPVLEYLKIDRIHNASEHSSFWEVIFGVERFSQLSYCHLRYLRFSSKPSWHPVLSLRSFSASISSNEFDFDKVLSLLPNVRHLELYTYGEVHILSIEKYYHNLNCLQLSFKLGVTDPGHCLPNIFDHLPNLRRSQLFFSSSIHFSPSDTTRHGIPISRKDIDKLAAKTKRLRSVTGTGVGKERKYSSTYSTTIVLNFEDCSSGSTSPYIEFNGRRLI